MVKAIRFIVLLAVVLALAGCPKMTSIYRNHDFEKGSAIMDIKQRAIVAKMGYVDDGTSAGNATVGNNAKIGANTAIGDNATISDGATIGGNNSREKELMICAEPSPDAMSAYAAELAGKANLPKSVEIELAGAFHESTSNVGLRTQSIQLLRDRSYRLCEARMNGFISNAQFELQMRREQRNTVALLAIEQLTGVVKAPTVTINTKGTAEIARNVDDLIAQKEQKDKEIDAKKKEKSEVTGTDEAAEKKKKALQDEIDELDKSSKAIADSIEKDRSMVASGSATAVVHADGLPTQRSDAHIQAIADTVDKIVEYTQTDDLGQMCLIYMQKGDMQAPLKDICDRHFNKIAEQQDALKTVIVAFGTAVGKAPVNDANDLKVLAEAIKLLSGINTGSDLAGIEPGAKTQTDNSGGGDN